jgi:hypothetical protein
MFQRATILLILAASGVYTAGAWATTTPTDPTLKVTIAGHGTVTSRPSGINCPKKCSAHFFTNARVRPPRPNHQRSLVQRLSTLAAQRLAGRQTSY